MVTLGQRPKGRHLQAWHGDPIPRGGTEDVKSDEELSITALPSTMSYFLNW